MEDIYSPSYYYSFAIDLTNRCNGKCIFCPRNNFSKKVNPRSELDLNIFKKVFDHDYLNHISSIIINGNLGEPTFYSKMFEFLDYISEINSKVNIFMSTNGSIRPSWWWKELAKKMEFNKGNIIRFALDGLHDTHHLYRGTHYKIVLRNLMTYINAGGKADWQFIVFKHNEHQLEQAKKIASSMGCSGFVTLVSRHYQEEGLERPTMLKNAKTKVELCSESNRDHLFCTPIENRHLYMSHEGFIYPCCDYGLFDDFRKIEDYPIKAYIEYLRSLNDLDMSKSTLSDALNSRFFKYIIENKDDLSRCKTSCKIHNNNSNDKIIIRETVDSIRSDTEKIVPRNETIITNKIQTKLNLKARGSENV